MINERRRDQLINVTETYMENFIEKMIAQGDFLKEMTTTYKLELDEEEKEFVTSLFVHHLILDIF